MNLAPSSPTGQWNRGRLWVWRNYAGAGKNLSHETQSNTHLIFLSECACQPLIVEVFYTCMYLYQFNSLSLNSTHQPIMTLLVYYPKKTQIFSIRILGAAVLIMITLMLPVCYFLLDTVVFYILIVFLFLVITFLLHKKIPTLVTWVVESFKGLIEEAFGWTSSRASPIQAGLWCRI